MRVSPSRPAAVLLHLGPGLGNGLANLHNARRARVPMVVVVGDHATYHKKYDAPLESDIDALAGSVSGWVHRTADTADVATDAAEAIASKRCQQADFDVDSAGRRFLDRGCRNW
jgi:acetolactate synthase-1/2/3 large subunit